MDVEQEISKIQGFVDKANYHAAVNLAISGMNECRRQQDQAGVDRFLGVINGIVQVMQDAFGSKP